MSPRSVLITGANRGIGLGLVKEFLKNAEIKHLFATCRKPEEANELQSISDNRLHIIAMNVECDDSIKEATHQVDAIVGEYGLNLLLNNAGVKLDYVTDQQPNREVLIRSMNTNAIGVAVVTQFFLPLLKRASSASSSQEVSATRAAIINISSGLGSIANNTSGSYPMNMFAYKMSKTALNSLAKTLAIDLEKEGILVASFCPGWVQTDMGGPHAHFTVPQSCAELVPTIYGLRKEHTGGYFEKNGTVIPF